MSKDIDKGIDWNLLIGYTLAEAEQVLQEEEVEYQLQFTAPPGKQAPLEEVRVIAVKRQEKLVLVCAATDWTIS